MKKESIISLSATIILFILSSLISIYSTDIRAHMTAITNNGLSKLPDLFISMMSYGCMFLAFSTYVFGVIKRRGQVADVKVEKTNTRIDETQQSIKGLKDYADECLREIKEGLREEEKRRNNADAIIRTKLIALKDFRDKEMVRITDHFNAQIQTFEDRMKELQEALKEKGIEINLTRLDYVLDPNAKLNQARYNDVLNAQMKAYNKAFEDWGVDDYGIAKKTHLQP